MTTIKYVQLESADFLSDPDFQMMNSTERGIYCSVIFYMYLNDGRILNEPNRIKKLCNVDINFENSWEVVQKKFVEKNGYLTHKRVRRELAKAKKFIQHQRRAGLASGKARQPRFNHGSTTDATQRQPNKVKESKVKQSNIKENKEKRFRPPALEEVETYCKEKSLSIKPEYVWGFYEKKGWKVGRSQMKNWHIAVSQAEAWGSAPRVKRQVSSQDEAAYREKKRQEMLKEYAWFKTETKEKLIQFYKNNVTVRWVINELRPEIKVLAERAKEMSK